MDELTKCGKFGTEKNQLRARMLHTQNYQSNRVENCTKEYDKYEQRVAALCLLPAQKMNVKRNCWFLNEITCEKVLWKLLPMECTLQNLQKQNHLRRRKREQLALMAADVWMWGWVYNITVYNTKGTTWSGSPLWKYNKCNKRYDSTSLLTDSRWFIYKHCTDLLEYAGLVWPSSGA
jgi:hypothetical protein